VQVYMGLSDMLANSNKSEVSKATPAKATTKDQTQKIRQNFEEGILKLSEEFLDKANRGQIQINDTKDVKNIMGVAQVLFADTNTDADTPQVSSQFNNIYATVLNLPPDTDVKPADITRSVSDMSAEDIKRLVDKTAEKQNAINSDTI